MYSSSYLGLQLHDRLAVIHLPKARIPQESITTESMRPHESEQRI